MHLVSMTTRSLFLVAPVGTKVSSVLGLVLEPMVYIFSQLVFSDLLVA